MTRDELFNLNRVEGIVPVSRALIGEGLGQDADITKNKYFIMTATGDGMLNAGIHNGDTMIFYKVETAPSDALVCVLMDGELACRRYIKVGKKVRFRREDGITPDRKVKDYEIIGVLVSVVRKFNYCA
jgi:repressor LexA